MTYKHKLLIVWIRYVVVIVASVLVSISLVSYTTNDQLIKDCIKNSNHKLIVSTFFDGVILRDKKLINSINKKLPRDSEEYRISREFSQGSVILRATINMPDNWDGDPKTRGDIYELRKNGCEDAFKSPISWID